MPFPQFFRSKATTSNLYQQPRDTGYDMSKLRTNKTIKFENHLRQRHRGQGVLALLVPVAL